MPVFPAPSLLCLDTWHSPKITPAISSKLTGPYPKASPDVGLLFIMPGYDNMLRVNRQVTPVIDPELLSSMSVNDRSPRLAIVVKVSEVFLKISEVFPHCAKTFRRSRLWDPDHFQDRSEMPSPMKVLMDQTTGIPDKADQMLEMDQGLEV